MSVGYSLANFSKKQVISFIHLPVNTKDEICGHHVSAKIVSLYMLDNLGDEISFFSDQYYEKDWKLSASIDEIKGFEDVTEEYLNKAEQLGFIKGRLKDILDDDEPEIFLWRFDSSDF